VKHNSQMEYEQFLINSKNISNLKGCFDKDNTYGQIYLSTFKISIKSLVTKYSYQKNFKLDQWQDLCGFMKKRIYQNINNPA
jgi:hypothetical protein